MVDAYAGYKGEETPLRADDGRRYVLRYDVDELIWELVMREADR